MATWNTDVMAAQNGVDVEENVPSVTHYDVIQAGTGGTLATTYKAIGLAGTEIGYIYKLADDGTAEETFVQDATASAGKFSYDPTTKAFTFAETETPIEGERYACVYDFRPAASSQITISGDAIPDVAIATFYGLARDICNGELYPAQIKGRVQINGNWSFDVSSDGDPAVQDLSMEFVKGCLENDLYTFTVYTNDEYTG